MPVRLHNTDEVIVADTRIRRKFDETKIRELADDIASNGLYHPPVLRSVGETYHLVAGERRLRAIKLLQQEKREFICDGLTISPPLLPFNLIKDLSDADALEVEINENLLRVDLDWKDVVSARARLLELRKEQPLSETAKELAETSGMSERGAHDALSRAAAIAPHLDDPALKNAQSEAQAFRAISKRFELELTAELLKRESRETKHKLFLGDYRKQEIPRNYFDAIIVDPPYGISAEHFGNLSSNVHEYNDDPEYAQSLMYQILRDGFALWTREKAILFMFIDIEHFIPIRDEAAKAGWRVFRTPIVWAKGNQGFPPWGPYHFTRNTEYILYATKGNRMLAQTPSDLISGIPSAQEKLHAAQKPIGLYTYLMKLACQPGDRVIDPCCGAGTIFPAANACGTEAWGVEIHEDMYNLALTQMESAE
ncbi:MAG: DNA methyltransferase [Nitrospinae bacterium]|nr:DNA methyltransferase [Nitrospinota bacterium]